MDAFRAAEVSPKVVEHPKVLGQANHGRQNLRTRNRLEYEVVGTWFETKVTSRGRSAKNHPLLPSPFAEVGYFGQFLCLKVSLFLIEEASLQELVEKSIQANFEEALLVGASGRERDGILPGRYRSSNFDQFCIYYTNNSIVIQSLFEKTVQQKMQRAKII